MDTSNRHCISHRLSPPQRKDLVLLHVTSPILFPGTAPAAVVGLDDVEVIGGGVAVLAHDPSAGLLEDHPRREPHGHVAHEVHHGVRHPVPAG
jgi:hypothetical protein